MLTRCRWRRRQTAEIPENMQRDGIARKQLSIFWFCFHSFYLSHKRAQAASNECVNVRDGAKVCECVSVCVCCIFFLPIFAMCFLFLFVLTSLFRNFFHRTLCTCNAVCYFCFLDFLFVATVFYSAS